MFSNHELEDVGIVFPHTTFANLEFHHSTFVSFCVDIAHVHEDL